jgi:hypothetical protein
LAACCPDALAARKQARVDRLIARKILPIIPVVGELALASARALVDRGYYRRYELFRK